MRIFHLGPMICISEKARTTSTTSFMKKEACIIAGCAAPAPVKIASHLIGRGLLKKAKDETQTSDTAQTTAPQQ